MRHIRQDGLTDSRLYGVVCEKHPELNGLRRYAQRKYAVTDDGMKIYKYPGRCIGCERERGRVRDRVKETASVFELSKALGVSKIPHATTRRVIHRLRG